MAKIFDQITFEIEQIDHLLEKYAPLFQRAQAGKPDLVETTAIASVLHSFYNGLESVFLTIAKGIDKNVPTGPQWHRDLLTQMTEPKGNRTAVLTTEMAHNLADYLGFRHFYRHAYSFTLDWEEMKELVLSLPETWEQVKSQLNEFSTREGE